MHFPLQSLIIDWRTFGSIPTLLTWTRKRGLALESQSFWYLGKEEGVQWPLQVGLFIFETLHIPNHRGFLFLTKMYMYVPRIENYMFALLISEIPPEGLLFLCSVALKNRALWTAALTRHKMNFLTDFSFLLKSINKYICTWGLKWCFSLCLGWTGRRMKTEWNRIKLS